MRKKTRFNRFCNGMCSFHLIDDDGNAGKKKEKLQYEERTIGVKRFYEAATAKVRVDRLIRVPYRPWLTTEYLAVIGKEVYEITQVQLIPDSEPKTNDVTLRIARQRRVADGDS